MLYNEFDEQGGKQQPLLTIYRLYATLFPSNQKTPTNLINPL